MLIAVLECIGGLILLIVGAEFIVSSGTRFAARFNISPVVIGATIVAVGTSTPELAVGIDAVLSGSGDLAVGNIAGTNVVNILLILGLSALAAPLAIRTETLWLDLPMIAVASLMLLYMAWDGVLTRSDGIILVLCSVAYTAAIVHSARRESRAIKMRIAEELEVISNPSSEGYSWQRDLLVLMAGITVVVLGADWLVEGAIDLARHWGVSDEFIGLTIIAIGTSSPELVTTLISTLRKERDIAIGNLLGSSAYNIFIILGLTLAVPGIPIKVAEMLVKVDIPVMTMVGLLCVPVFYSGRQVSRWEGGSFVALYAAYLSYLIATRA
nr:sodium:calcium antiporter [Rhizobium sp. Q54]